MPNSLSYDSGQEDIQLKPIFGNSILYISSRGLFSQILTFDFYNEDQKYFEKIQNERIFYENELETIKTNMQNILDNCVHKINGELVFPEVVEVEIDFKTRSIPYFFWVINFKAELKKGVNIYSADIDEEQLDYNINSIYIFEPPIKPLSVVTSIHYEINEERGIIKYWANKNDWVGPREVIRFRL
ncbi:MAG: hypothetical protein ACTSU2_04715 [Promethearchaeota archaeon]